MAATKKGSTKKPVIKKLNKPRKTSGRKSKRKSSARKGSATTYLWAILSALILAVAVYFAWWLFTAPSHTTLEKSYTPKPNSSVVYEEPHQHQSLEEALHQIDDAIFKSLRKCGLPPEETNLHISSGEKGNITEITCKPSSDVCLKKIRQTLELELKNPHVKKVWLNQEKGYVLLVHYKGQLTHKISCLKSSSHQKTVDKLASKAQKDPRPLACLIIDDMGYQKKPAELLANMGISITFSILPHAPFGQTVADLAKQKGLEILLHLPMQPKSYPKIDPGPGKLLLKMPANQLIRITKENLKSVPYAVGVNNHMGSLFTENRTALKPVLQVIKEKNLLFLDSFTSPNSQAYSLAKGMGIRAWRRHVFLDHNTDAKAIRKQMERFFDLTKRRNRVVAIGHPHSSTIAVIKEYRKRLRKELHLVPLSTLIP